MSTRWGAAGVAVLAIAAHYCLVAVYAPKLLLSLGSTTFPHPVYLAVVCSWVLFGSLASASIAFLVVRVVADRGLQARFEREWLAGSDRAWMIAGSAFAFAATAAVRYGLLHGTAIADDEASYEFAARLLASGRMSVPSHALKLFFDHPFFINDGQYRSIYFLGWPALMVPGVLLGVPGLMNAVYFAASVPAVFLVARELWGSAWARGTLLLWVSSPFLLVLSSTQLSHTTCIAALAWAIRLLLVTRSERAGWPSHALLAVALSLAFFIRPLSGLGLGAPVALAWLRDRWASSRSRVRALVAFGLVAAVFASLFLGVQRQQTGSAWTTGYQRAVEYHEENGYRYSAFTPGYFTRAVVIDVDRPGTALIKSVSGWLRLLTDLGGWPLVLALGLLLAAHSRSPGLLWGVFAGGTASVLLLKDPGIDTFGPVHYAELSLPVLLLFAAGVRHAVLLLQQASEGCALESRRVMAATLPIAVSMAAVLTAWIGFVPARWTTLTRISENIRVPELAVREAGVGRAVVFSSFPWIWPPCVSEPARHFRFLRPANDPDLENEILWVNHVDIDADRKLLATFPDRKGFAVSWSATCEARVIPLAQATPDLLPPAEPRRWW